ncbi:PAS domain S-box protein [Mucilaginibacter sp.]|uniref:PAS domain-containing protein n=1 Tax=Mucilaginibacter sp. TaxID=1882438 RepID=UPI003D145506
MDHPKKNRPIIITSIIIITAGTVIMLGWILNIAALKSIFPGFAAMKFNTALCFVLLGITLLVNQNQLKKYNAIAFIGSLFVTTVSLLTLLQYILHNDTGIDNLILTDHTPQSARYPFPGRMTFNSALNFMLLSLGFLAQNFKNRLLYIVSECFFQTVIILSGAALIGYIYGAELFNTLFAVTSMTTNTAILFFALSLTASLQSPSIGIARLFAGKQVGNKLAKRLFILILLMVIVFGYARVSINYQHITFFSIETVIALIALVFLTLSLLIIWNTANWLNKIDAQRSAAEESVRLMNTELEKRVEERSAEIIRSEEKYRSLIEQASDAIYILEIAGRFTDANESMCKMIGYSHDELLQLNISDIVDPEELKTDPLPLSIGRYDRSIVRERRFIRKDGVIFTVEVNVKRFSDDRIMVIARDISDRKKMETELREAEVKFRTIAEKSIVGVYIVQKGRFTYVNPRFAAVFGYTPEELINTRKIEFVFDESYRDIANEHVRRRMTGEVESVHYEAMGKRKDGTTNWVEYYGSRTVIGDEPTIIGSMIDITERRKAEEELKSSEQKYKLLFDSNPTPMWMIDKANQNIIAANEAAALLYGYTRDELLLKNVKEFRLYEDRADQMEGYKLELNDFNNRGIIRHLKKDGSIMFVNMVSHDIIFEGRPVRLSQTNDVTEKLIAEQALQQSEANLQTILTTTDTVYALFDSELKILAFNQNAVEFVKTRYDYDPKKGDLLTDYFSAYKVPNFIGFTKDVLKGNNVNYEVDYPQKDGSVLWYYLSLFPITNEHNEILGIMLSMYDITERKHSEQNLKNAYDRIQDHMNSIKNMAWKQSHLIRSPLANLMGLYLLLKEDPSNKEVLLHMGSELNRMDAIIIEMANEVTDDHEGVKK